ncbi:MAG TPA: tyrosine-type recombinase/integrase, partial [Acidobacteriota bacterium]|nr:tyrosine-type recombinase/integrase [Acidobacteriota bacterium]
GVRRKAGIEDFHFHDFRHTAPTWLAEMGVDAFTIADILGHSTIQMSMRYTHATDTRKANAMHKLSQICHKPGDVKVG